MKHLKMDSTKAIAAIEGYGNVAQYAAVGFVEQLGGKVACVSCWDRNDKKSYTYSHKDGINPRFLLTIVDQYGTINKDEATQAGYIIEDGEAWITKEADVLIPAAIEGAVVTASDLTPELFEAGRARESRHGNRRDVEIRPQLLKGQA